MSVQDPLGLRRCASCGNAFEHDRQDDGLCAHCGQPFDRPAGQPLTAVCYLCGAERPMDTMAIEAAGDGMVWICDGDAITDCETRRGI